MVWLLHWCPWQVSNSILDINLMAPGEGLHLGWPLKFTSPSSSFSDQNRTQTFLRLQVPVSRWKCDIAPVSSLWNTSKLETPACLSVWGFTSLSFFKLCLIFIEDLAFCKIASFLGQKSSGPWTWGALESRRVMFWCRLLGSSPRASHSADWGAESDSLHG